MDGIKILSLWFVCRYYPKSAALKLQFVYFPTNSTHTVFSLCLSHLWCVQASVQFTSFRTLWQTCKHTHSLTHSDWCYLCVYTFLWHLCMKSNQRTTSLTIWKPALAHHGLRENSHFRDQSGQKLWCVFEISVESYCNKIVLSVEQSDVFGNLSLDFVVVAFDACPNWVALL